MSTPQKTPRPLLTEKSRRALIHILVFLGGLLAGAVGAPFAPLIKVGTTVAVEALEQAPVREEEAPAPLMAPVSTEPAVPAEPPVETMPSENSEG